MSYYEMTTENLETLKSDIERKLDTYVGMSFASPRSEFVTYEIDSIDPDEILINANHYFNGLIIISMVLFVTTLSSLLTAV